MPVAIQRYADGTYRVHHRPVHGDKSRYRWIDGPVFMRTQRTPSDDGRADVKRDLIFLQYGMGDGPWIVMSREYLTGKAHRLLGTGEWEKRTDAEADLRALAAKHGWREITETGEPDFICRGGKPE